MKNSEVDLQRSYYAQTAQQYDEWHLDPKDEHFFALSVLTGLIDYLQVKSILDVGSGTGRALQYIKEKKPGIRVIGIEPVRELRMIGYRKGLPESELIEGNATALAYRDGEFDLVCEFGVLHHLREQRAAVREMLRVARIAIFLSDCNNFGQGPWVMRKLKQTLNLLGLWRLADNIKSSGKGYSISPGDGLTYSYSVFNDYHFLKSRCQHLYLFNTKGDGIDPYSNASQVALLGVKDVQDG